jgi:hypothetical protein
MRYGLRAAIEENTEAVSIERQEAGCFVLVSNIAKQEEGAYDARSILQAYKEQHGIEQNFAFLKDPVIVNNLGSQFTSNEFTHRLLSKGSKSVWTVEEEHSIISLPRGFGGALNTRKCI